MQRSGTRRTLFFLISNLVVWVFVAQLSTRVAAQAPASAPNNAQQAQIDKGRLVVGQACAACHPTIGQMVQAYKQTPQQWRSTVFFMISRGAQVMPDEIEPVISYIVWASSQPATSAAGRGGAGRGGAGRGGAGGPATPEVEARAIMERTCQMCHDMTMATTKLASEDWNTVIGKMIGYGAMISPADRQTLVAYLNGLAK